MAVELRKGKDLSRRIGGLVVRITEEGVFLRGEHKRNAKAVFVPWATVAKKGLERDGASLSEEEWSKPLETLKRLSAIKKAHRPRKRKAKKQ